MRFAPSLRRILRKAAPGRGRAVAAAEGFEGVRPVPFSDSARFSARRPVLAALGLALALAGCAGTADPPAPPPLPPRPTASYEPVDYAALPGWAAQDLRPSFRAYLRGCEKMSPALLARPEAEGLPRRAFARWASACQAANRLDANDNALIRTFFERYFEPHRVLASGNGSGHFTGYYEPELLASKKKGGKFTVPLYAPPPGAGTGARLPARAEIENGRVARNWKVLYWANDPVDVFIMHIQGSGRVRLVEGGWVRVGYAAQNGHPFTGIAQPLRDNGYRDKDLTMNAIRAWLRENPRAARRVMNANPSFIFFKVNEDKGGPIGAQGVPLTEMASMAVDPRFVPLGAPVYVDTNWPGDPGRPLRRLVMAQDTGGVIKGAIRGDFYWGTGEKAFDQAGRMSERGGYFVFLPRAQ